MPLRITSSSLVSIVMRLASTLSVFHQDLCGFRARLDRDHVRRAFHTVDPTHGVVCAFLSCCRSTRRLSVTQSGQLPGQRAHLAEPTSDPPDDRRSTGRYSTQPLLCMRTGSG
jgi:hypothetical protein